MQSKVAGRGQLGTRAGERKADPQMGRQMPLCQPPSLTHPSPQFLGPSARPSGTTTGALTEAGRRGPWGSGGRQGQLTSDRKVCADFWAPMCSRYSYTYSANLQAGWKWLRLSGGPGSGQPQTPPSGFLEGLSDQAPAFSWAGGDQGQGAPIESSLQPPPASH